MATVICVICHINTTQRRSLICEACRQALRASGQEWCFDGGHAVDAGVYVIQARRCRECLRRHNRLQERKRTAARRAEKANQIESGLCATCHASLTRHARCEGCTRLLHGSDAAQPLCRLCARDRANGVPPKGYELQELERVQ